MMLYVAFFLIVSLLLILTLRSRRPDPRHAALRETAEALRQSERRLREFAEMASDWFWEQDADLRFKLVGSSAPLAAPDGILRLHKHRWDFADTSLAPEMWEQHKRDLLDRKPFRDFRYAARGKDGNVRHVCVNGNPVYDDNGVFIGYRGTGHDITAQVEAEAELRSAKDQAEAANRSKSAFLAQISHELRTPLNAILGFSDLIHHRTAGPVGEKYVEYAREIQVSGHNLLSLINDLIEMSQLEAGSYQLQDECVDIDTVIQASLCIARSRAAAADIRIDTPSSHPAVTLRADAKAITQALLQVMENAIKFTPSGGFVSLRTEITPGGDLTFVVTDTGIGIDRAALPRIFEPFYQVDSSSTRRFDGSGLGLTISRKLIALHGGSLNVRSRLGHGTTVRITLPAARVKLRQENNVEPPEAEDTPSHPTSLPRSAEPVEFAALGITSRQVTETDGP